MPNSRLDSDQSVSLQASLDTLESLKKTYPHILSSVQPEIDLIKSDISHINKGEAFYDLKWHTKQQLEAEHLAQQEMWKAQDQDELNKQNTKLIADLQKKQQQERAKDQEEVIAGQSNNEAVTLIVPRSAEISWADYKPVDNWAPITSGITTLKDGDKLLLRATVTELKNDLDSLGVRLTDSNGDSLEHYISIPKGQSDDKLLALYNKKLKADFALHYSDRGGWFYIDGIRDIPQQ